MSNIDWSKAPAHATHWCPGNARIEEGWIYKAGQEFYSCYAEKSCEHIPNFPAWRALRLIPRPVEPAAWDGKGLPPVGESVCEYLGAHQYDEWTVVNIFAHWGEQVFVDYGDGWRAERDISRFRPIRTPEQIAAEKRIEEINEMAELSLYGHYAFTLAQAKIACAVLHDKGYRKVAP